MWKIIFAIITVATMFMGVDCSGKSMKVIDAWAKPTAADAKSAEVYLTIKNEMGSADTLTTVVTYIAENASVMTIENTPDGGVPKVLQTLTIDTDKEIRMLPGHTYIYLDKLKQPLKAGDKFPLTLTFDKGGQVLEDVVVVPAGTLTYVK